MASAPGPVLEFLGRVAYEALLVRPMLPTYLHLLVSALFPIYTAAYASLSRPPSAAPPKKRTKDATLEDSDEEVLQKIEGLSPSDAITFPILAGLTLSGLYFLLKWLQDPALLNQILGFYFSGIGLVFATKFLKDALSVARSICLPTQYSAHGLVWKVDERGNRVRAWLSTTKPAIFRETSPLPGVFRRLPLPTFALNGLWTLRRSVYAKARLRLHMHKLVTFKKSVDTLDVISLLLSSFAVGWHAFVSKPWFLTNFLGFSFCYGSLQFITPTTAWTGTLVLGALFFYDIYFVFYTPMMVTVATKLDVPIKLLFPRPDGCVLPVGAAEGSTLMEEYLQCLAKKRTMAMLGLGDIVVPGMMLAFALRFDLYLFYLRQKRQQGISDENDGGTSQTKPTYKSVTGGWGEWFWTSRKLLSTELKAKQFRKTYFYVTISGYLFGMVVTLIVMQVAEHAQPALLYLVPGVLVSFWGTALLKGDLKLLWTYTEEPEDDSKEDKVLKGSEIMEEQESGKAMDTVNGNPSMNVQKLDQDSGKGQMVDGTNGLAVNAKGTSAQTLTTKNDTSSETTESGVMINGEPTSNSDVKEVTEQVKTREGKDKRSGSRQDSEKDCRNLFLLSITLPSKTRTNSSSEKKQTQPKGGSSHDRGSQTVASGQTSIASSRRPSKMEDEPLPDVTADNAVLAKLKKEVSELSADTVNDKGGEPPEKRRRKG